MKRPLHPRHVGKLLSLITASLLSLELAGTASVALGQESPAAVPSPTPVPTPAPAPAPRPWYEEITVNGFVSTSYSYNLNRPSSGVNQFRVFDFDDNSIKVDVAEVVLQKAVTKPGEVGFRVDAVAGGSIPRVSAAAGLFRDASGKAQDFDLQQAFLSTIAPVGSGLRLDIGKFVTNHGYELIDGYDGYNDNATRSFLFGYAIPFTHTGIKASYTFSDQVAGMVMLVNGWDNAKDNNTAKSFGAQLIWTPSKTVTASANYMVGAERSDTNGDARNMVNVNAQWKVTDQTVLTVDLVYGTEPDAVTQGQTAMWNGIVGYARFGLSDSFAVILRGELFNDRDGARTGVAQKLTGLTLTPELKVGSHVVFRGDLRVDFSDKEVFEGRDGALTKKQQPTVLLNALYTF
ncbi:MAG: porin [Thermoanaerobaculia bacterium]|nr:porin [Thermoanaerobaculia bacterium]